MKSEENVDRRGPFRRRDPAGGWLHSRGAWRSIDERSRLQLGSPIGAINRALRKTHDLRGVVGATMNAADASGVGLRFAALARARGAWADQLMPLARDVLREISDSAMVADIEPRAKW